jgi:LmbE family N-acetylglucosaminyl deacetylase
MVGQGGTGTDIREEERKVSIAGQIMRVFSLGLIALFGCLGSALAQGGYGYRPGWTQDRIREEIRGLGVTGSVLYVAAHPDDENTRLLSWLANEVRCRTAYLSLTRGDGGQNLLGEHTGYDLGQVRTQELLAARRVDGAEQFFTRANDFGYSKSPEETFTHWDKEQILKDVVWAIRLFKPDLIVTRFSPLPAATHGHHTASAQLAVEAFFAAADSSRFPDQLQSVTVWQAKRVVWNTSWWFYGRQDYDKSQLLRLNVGGYNPRLGLSYGEMAAESRSMHQSQGFGSARQRGSEWEYFQWLAGDTAKVSPLEGCLRSLETDPPTALWSAYRSEWEKLNILSQGAWSTRWAHSLIQMRLLLDSMSKINGLNAEDSLWVNERSVHINQILLETLGIWEEAVASNAKAVPGDSLDFEWHRLRRLPVHDVGCSLRSLKLWGLDSNFQYRVLKEWDTEFSEFSKVDSLYSKADSLKLGYLEFQVEDSLAKNKFKAYLPNTLRYAGPFWKASPNETAFYAAHDTMAHRNETPPSFVLETVRTLVHEGNSVDIVSKLPLHYKWTDPVLGERYRPVETVPAYQIRLDAPRYYATDARSEIRMQLALRIEPGPLRQRYPDTIKLDLWAWPAGWVVLSKPMILESPQTDTLYTLEVILRDVSKGKGEEGPLLPGLWRAEQGSWWPIPVHGIQQIEYNHLPVLTRTEEVSASLIRLQVAKPTGTVGYLRGAGDALPQALRVMGYKVTDLDPGSVTLEQLKACQSVLIGVRFYNTYAHAGNLHPLLMEYARLGGHVIVQYQTTANLLWKQMGPFPLKIGRGRVTEEHAAVEFLDEKHPLLSNPNPITSRDFEDWVQERGLYFGESWDPRWKPLLRMRDSGNTEPDQDGALLTARYGRGAVTYCGLALFRQCGEGVRGSYRLLQNLVSYAPRP